MHIYIYCIYTYIHYIYILYISRERDRERERERLDLNQAVCRFHLSVGQVRSPESASKVGCEMLGCTGRCTIQCFPWCRGVFGGSDNSLPSGCGGILTTTQVNS